MLGEAYSDLFGSPQRCQEVLVLVAVGVREVWVTAGRG